MVIDEVKQENSYIKWESGVRAEDGAWSFVDDDPQLTFAPIEPGTHAHVSLTISGCTFTDRELLIYYALEGNALSEECTRTVPFEEGVPCVLDITAERPVTLLRIDPSTQAGTCRVEGFEVSFELGTAEHAKADVPVASPEGAKVTSLSLS
ncbi:MAG: hypothetical protein PHR15_07465 [Atopobiaceae bacterium]|jgi:hypothetical protein|nr:hypothetical protein [Atopobiaceae bacterium]MCH4180852.1 hypothetical protein [Atopobiaceae bacterium]MCH4213475.1 hypothetical protein [Atopobiaceae bacterium]MCH4230425.1 hypothetical protein [Atopobiaceae bacterium]MCH4277144.1 hypothetical protein [Atopobiaceae bacterium]